MENDQISNCKTNNGFIVDGINIKNFKNYDYVLLGDIHKFQYLDKDKRVAYCSSLISQNFSETDDYHGYLRWDILINYIKLNLYNIL